MTRLSLTALLLASAVVSFIPGSIKAQEAPARPATSASGDTLSTATDFLSDDDWRRLPREERRRRSRGSYIARFEPSGKPSVEKLQTYIGLYKDIVIYDARLAHFAVKAEHVAGTTGTVNLSGEVSVPQLKSGVESTLQQLGFIVAENTIHVLPDESLAPNYYALATTTAATLRKEPRANAEQVNSVGMGGWMRLLREARPEDLTTTQPGRRARNADPEPEGLKWYLAQSPEAYLGFVREDHVMPAKEYNLPDALLKRPTTATLAQKPFVVPAGANLHRTEMGYVVPGVGALLPENSDVVELSDPSFTEDEVLEISEPLMNTRYEWGGVTDKGIDCSGFTQFIFKTRGIFLPRDAEEQAIVGQIVAFGKDVVNKAEPGDVIFFVGENGKVNHVGISLGKGRLIHSSGPGVHISEFEEVTEEGARRLVDRILFARRVLSR